MATHLMPPGYYCPCGICDHIRYFECKECDYHRLVIVEETSEEHNGDIWEVE